MSERKVELKSSEPNGLTSILKDLIEPNLNDSDLFGEMEEWSFIAEISESTSGVKSTVIVDRGEVVIRNDGQSNADVRVSADFETLSNIGSGGILTGLKAILSDELKKEGSLFDLIRLQKILST